MELETIVIKKVDKNKRVSIHTPVSKIHKIEITEADSGDFARVILAGSAPILLTEEKDIEDLQKSLKGNVLNSEEANKKAEAVKAAEERTQRLIEESKLKAKEAEERRKAAIAEAQKSAEEAKLAALVRQKEDLAAETRLRAERVRLEEKRLEERAKAADEAADKLEDRAEELEKEAESVKKTTKKKASTKKVTKKKTT